MSTDSLLGGSRPRKRLTTDVDYEDYDDFRTYYRAVADSLFPFPSYNDFQDEILYEVLEAYLEDDYLNVVVEGPTGIGKSAINVTVSQVLGVVSTNQLGIEEHFDITLRHLTDGSAFYTTPQKSLRNQLAADEDLRDAVQMLKARADYVCGVSNNNCADCYVNNTSDESCRNQSECTYWGEKMQAIQSHTAVITFAMLIVDNYLPEGDEFGRISFSDRDLVIVDEGHSSEGQTASLFAGFDLSPWGLPKGVYGDAGEKIDWDDDRLEDVKEVLMDINVRIHEYIEAHKDSEENEKGVSQCEAMQRKLQYALKTHEEGEGWVINVNPVSRKNAPGKTKGMEIKPVRVGDFLDKFIWSRGRRRLVTSATIPFRNNVGKWAKRIGLDENVKFISKPTPFPREHRLIHTHTMVGSMGSKEEDDNWAAAMDQIREIASHHKGEKGLIHSVSYPRTKRVVDSLGDGNAIADQRDLDTDAVIDRWQNSDKDILVTPAATEGVDLYGDKCRWQVLLKVSFAHLGDSRVNYLVNEESEWDWYMENAAIDFIQSVGRAVRGPEPSEAASYYVIDSKVKSLISRTSPPDYILDAITGEPPEHWSDPSAAPWRESYNCPVESCSSTYEKVDSLVAHVAGKAPHDDAHATFRDSDEHTPDWYREHSR